MGIRNLTIVIQDGKPKIAQYGQWDGYPEGQGITALQFCQKHLTTKKDRKAFGEAVAAVRTVTTAEQKAAQIAAGVEGKDFITFEEASKLHHELPYVNRDHGAMILEMVRQAPDYVWKDDGYGGSGKTVKLGPAILQNEYEFAADSLFCKWAYVIDLDKETFEVYKGFNEEPLKDNERFYALQEQAKKNHEAHEKARAAAAAKRGEVYAPEAQKYYPIRHMVTWVLSDLPSKETFLKATTPEDEDE